MRLLYIHFFFTILVNICPLTICASLSPPHWGSSENVYQATDFPNDLSCVFQDYVQIAQLMENDFHQLRTFLCKNFKIQSCRKSLVTKEELYMTCVYIKQTSNPNWLILNFDPNNNISGGQEHYKRRASRSVRTDSKALSLNSWKQQSNIGQTAISHCMRLYILLPQQNLQPGQIFACTCTVQVLDLIPLFIRRFLSITSTVRSSSTGTDQTSASHIPCSRSQSHSHAPEHIHIKKSSSTLTLFLIEGSVEKEKGGELLYKKTPFHFPRSKHTIKQKRSCIIMSIARPPNLRLKLQQHSECKQCNLMTCRY